MNDAFFYCPWLSSHLCLHFLSFILSLHLSFRSPPQMELVCRAEGVVRDSSEYRCLQSQFSVLYNESLILKAQLDEIRARLNTTRTARLRQLDHMEVLCVHFYLYLCESLHARHSFAT